MNATALAASDLKRRARGAPRLPQRSSRLRLWGVLRSTSRHRRVSAFDIVAHRVLWSLPFLARLCDNPRLERGAQASAGGARFCCCLRPRPDRVNWLLYVYAVTSGHILRPARLLSQPLANVRWAGFILKERLSWLQWSAIAIAAAASSHWSAKRRTN